MTSRALPPRSRGGSSSLNCSAKRECSAQMSWETFATCGAGGQAGALGRGRAEGATRGWGEHQTCH